MECRALGSNDVGQRIFAASIQPEPKLAMTLRATLNVQLRGALEFGLTLFGIVGVALLLISVQPRRMRLPVTLLALTVLTCVFVDWQFIGGFRPLDGGDDGIVYEGYARNMLRELLAGDIGGYLRGEESIYYFTPGLRYFLVPSHLIFGDTFLGYFSVILLLPFVVLALCHKILPDRWALAFVLGFTATPLGVVFGSTLSDYIKWASRNFADPFAFMLLLCGFVLIIPAPADKLDSSRVFVGGVLLAMATFCRPNLLLASSVIVIGTCLLGARRGQIKECVLLVVGFAVLVVSPLHNIVFGHSTVLFSNNVYQPLTMPVTPMDYFRALVQFASLNFTGEYVAKALGQLKDWLAGPHDLAATIPLNFAGVLILLRVGVGKAFSPWLRVVALATLLQHGIGVCYVNYMRYNLVTWLLTALVAAAWLQLEGLTLIDRYWPGLRACAARQKSIQWTGERFEALVHGLGYAEP